MYNYVIRYLKMWSGDYRKTIGFESNLDGHPIYVCNILRCGSYFFDNLIDKYDMVACFSFDGKLWIVSLYSNKIDCSEVAKRYGGGGHSGSAGFQCKELPFKMDMI